LLLAEVEKFAYILLVSVFLAQREEDYRQYAEYPDSHRDCDQEHGLLVILLELAPAKLFEYSIFRDPVSSRKERYFMEEEFEVGWHPSLPEMYVRDELEDADSLPELFQTNSQEDVGDDCAWHDGFACALDDKRHGLHGPYQARWKLFRHFKSWQFGVKLQRS